MIFDMGFHAIVRHLTSQPLLYPYFLFEVITLELEEFLLAVLFIIIFV